ncbi:MAG: hypothetical protein OHK0046_46090 [Anaerolineae bacterium]
MNKGSDFTCLTLIGLMFALLSGCTCGLLFTVSPGAGEALPPTLSATPTATMSAPTPTAEVRRFYTPAVALLNYRAGPGLTYSVRGQIRSGDVLMMMQTEGDWWAMCLVTLIAPYDCFGTYWVASWLLVETAL